MKKIKFFILAIVAIGFMSSCVDSLETYENYDSGLRYSSRISNLHGEIGIEKVKLSWINPTDKVASKIRIEYGDSLFVETDHLVSDYTIENLSSGGGYEFTVYTVDQFGNKSVGSTIFLRPYSQTYISTFVESVTTVKPTSSMQDEDLVIKWSNLLGNAFLRYTGEMSYTYTINNETVYDVLNSGNLNDETVIIPGITSPTTIDFEYTMKYWPIINNTLVTDTVSKTEKIKIIVDYPIENVFEKIDHSLCRQVTTIPFDNTTQHSSGYGFYNLFDGSNNNVWITARPDVDPVNGGNAQNNYEYPVSFTIDLGRATPISAIEFTGWEDYSQAPKKFEIWGSGDLMTGKPDSYWATTIPGEWQNDWHNLAMCDTDDFNRPSIRYNINPEKHKVRYIRFLVHEIYKLHVQWGGVYIRIAIGEMMIYKQPGMISRIEY